MSKENRKKFGVFFFFLMFPELYYENFFTNAYPQIFPLKNVSYDWKNIFIPSPIVGLLVLSYSCCSVVK